MSHRLHHLRAMSARLAGLAGPVGLIGLTSALAACGRRAGNSPAVSDDLVTQLVAEVDRLGHALSGPSLLSLLATLLLAWLLLQLVQAGVQLAWRLGLDAGHRLRTVQRWLNVLVAGAVGLLLLRKAVDAAPVLTSLITVTTATGLVLALARPLQNAVAGASLILRGRVREGDHIEVDSFAGTVSDVGLLRLRVRDAEGQTVLIPNRLLNERVVIVSRRTHLVPAVARVRLEAPPDPAGLERARQLALLSPWRVPGTPARAWVDDTLVAVELQTWSEEAVLHARRALEAGLLRAVGGEGRAKRGKEAG